MSNKAEQILAGLGGADNVVEIEQQGARKIVRHAPLKGRR